MDDKQFLEMAVAQAKLSVQQGGFPAGAVLVKDGQVIAKGVSLGQILHDPTSHAETATIRESCKTLGAASLAGATLYASMEPCLMCLCGAYWSDVSRIVFGCRRTDDMVKNGYYQGKTELQAVNQDNNRQIELVFIPDFEEDVLEIISDWEKSLV